MWNKKFWVAVFHQKQKFIMFKAYETFVWCLKDHFYAIYGRLKKKKKKKKKVQKIQSGIFGLFLTAMASRLSAIASTNISRHPSQKKPKKCQKQEFGG